MSDFQTKTTYNLMQQVKNSMAVANIDYHYGPYTSTSQADESIAEALRMAGKTVGIIGTDGICEEYWYQPTSAEDPTLVLKKKISSATGDAYSKSEIDTKFNSLATAFKYKGTVAKETDLPVATADELGNVYTVTEFNNAEYLCTRSATDSGYKYDWIIVGYDEFLTNEEIDGMF